MEFFLTIISFIDVFGLGVVSGVFFATNFHNRRSHYEGNFWGLDCSGNVDPNALVKITYKKTFPHQYGISDYYIRFMDLTRGRFGNYNIEFLPETKKYDGVNAFVVNKKGREIWTYTKNEAGYIEEIQPLSEDCFYRRDLDN
ncbi:hypothetical protein [Eubacterium callanderi]|uniref:Uncharacterized protein n=1 Tax=Eubacterium limosum TaxID=1736 RepID=A0A6N3HE01_EUBLI|nr:hypothetical protein [Eubacterium callanderi]